MRLGPEHASGERSRFWYGSDGQRYKREDGNRRTLYIGSVEVVTGGGDNFIRRYVAGVMVQEIRHGAASKRYLFHDHLFARKARRGDGGCSGACEENSIMRFTCLFIFLCISSTFSSDVFGAEEGPVCEVRCVNSARNACVVPIFALYSNPPVSCSDRVFFISGFLRRIGAEYLLFTDREWARFAVPEQAILLIYEDSSFEQGLVDHEGEYVRVAGRLRAASIPIYWMEIVMERPPQILPVHTGSDGEAAPRLPPLE